MMELLLRKCRLHSCQINIRYQSRNISFKFVLCSVKSNGHNSYQCNGIKLWTKLPFQSSDSKDSSKCTRKSFLLEKMKREEEN